MSTTRSTRWAVSLAAVILVLCGCASGSRTGSASTASPSPTPTAACPSIEDVPDDERDCAVYDPDAAMAENERYREELPVDADAQVALDELVEPARTELEALPVPATVDDVVAALASVGLRESAIQTLDNGTGVVFGAGAAGGCITGWVELDGTVTVEASGFIMDGGCLAMPGH